MDQGTAASDGRPADRPVALRAFSIMYRKSRFETTVAGGLNAAGHPDALNSEQRSKAVLAANLLASVGTMLANVPEIASEASGCLPRLSGALHIHDDLVEECRMALRMIADMPIHAAWHPEATDGSAHDAAVRQAWKDLCESLSEISGDKAAYGRPAPEHIDAAPSPDFRRALDAQPRRFGCRRPFDEEQIQTIWRQARARI